jgi:hypothetical protein
MGKGGKGKGNKHYCQLIKDSKAEEELTEIITKNFYQFDIYNINMCMGQYNKLNHPQSAINLYKWLVTNREGTKADIVSHNTAMKAYVDLDDPQSAIDLYKRLGANREGTKADIVSHNTAMKAYVDLGDPQSAIDLYEWLGANRKETKADIVSHNIAKTARTMIQEFMQSIPHPSSIPMPIFFTTTNSTTSAAR